jgi:glyoxylase I family protein
MFGRMQPQFSIEHLGLAAPDPAALKEWYEKVFGARIVFRSGTMPPAFILEMPGGGWIEIFQGHYGAPETSDNRLHGWRHIALRVTSIEEAKRELSNKGVEFIEEVKPAGGGGRVLFFQDPEGNLLHLVERTPDSPLLRREAGC